MKIAHSDKAPKAIGPNLQAVISNGLMFYCRQTALNTDTMTVNVQDVAGQTRIVIENMKAVLAAVALAAVLKNKKVFSGKRAGLIITGGNFDLSNLPF